MSVPALCRSSLSLAAALLLAGGAAWAQSPSAKTYPAPRDHASIVAWGRTDAAGYTRVTVNHFAMQKDGLERDVKRVFHVHDTRTAFSAYIGESPVGSPGGDRVGAPAPLPAVTREKFFAVLKANPHFGAALTDWRWGRDANGQRVRVLLTAAIGNWE